MGALAKRVLVVEDDLSLRPLWENFFRHRAESVELEWAVSCEEAVKMVRLANQQAWPFFLIITDIFLAGSGTGMELLSSDEVLNSKARTILVSVADRDEIIEKFRHLIPTTEVMSKPLDFKKYEPVINNILKARDFNGHR
jgi:response regulator of citrate/malate metabolism